MVEPVKDVAELAGPELGLLDVTGAVERVLVTDVALLEPPAKIVIVAADICAVMSSELLIMSTRLSVVELAVVLVSTVATVVEDVLVRPFEESTTGLII